MAKTEKTDRLKVTDQNGRGKIINIGDIVDLVADALRTAENAEANPVKAKSSAKGE